MCSKDAIAQPLLRSLQTLRHRGIALALEHPAKVQQQVEKAAAMLPALKAEFEDAARCPQGHPCGSFPTPDGNSSCDVCGQVQRLGTVLFGCRLCNFNLCFECVQLEVTTERQRFRIAKELAALQRSDDSGLPLPVLDAAEVIVHEKLGSGFFGGVHAGTWRGFPVALKFLTEDVTEELRKECRTLAALSHPHVMRFYGIIEGVEGAPLPPSWPLGARSQCMCCELLSKGTLLAFMKRQPREMRASDPHWILCIGLLADAVGGLAYLHEAFVMHRDIKSVNLLIDARGRIKLADFGLAKRWDASRGLGTLGGPPPTQTFRTDVPPVHTVSVGTFTHMAPEVLTGCYSTAADIFSLGIVISEVLIAEDAENIMEQTRDAKTFGLKLEGLKALLEPDLHPVSCHGLVDLAVACCDLEPSRRPSAGTLLHELLGSKASFKAMQ